MIHLVGQRLPPPKIPDKNHLLCICESAGCLFRPSELNEAGPRGLLSTTSSSFNPPRRGIIFGLERNKGEKGSVTKPLGLSEAAQKPMPPPGCTSQKHTTSFPSGVASGEPTVGPTSPLLIGRRCTELASCTHLLRASRQCEAALAGSGALQNRYQLRPERGGPQGKTWALPRCCGRAGGRGEPLRVLPSLQPQAATWKKP